MVVVDGDEKVSHTFDIWIGSLTFSRFHSCVGLTNCEREDEYIGYIK